MRISKTKYSVKEPTQPKALHLKNIQPLNKLRKAFTVPERHIRNDKDFKKLTAAFLKKDRQLKHSKLSLNEKQEAAYAFTDSVSHLLYKDKKIQTFDKSVREKLNELKKHNLYQHELKQEIDTFTQQKFKDIIGKDAPFQIDIITKPLAPSEIYNINKLPKTYHRKKPYIGKYDTSIRTSKQIIAEDGFYNTPSQGITNISKDPRAQKNWLKI